MLFSFHCRDYFVQILLCHVLTFFIKRKQRPSSHTYLRKSLLHKEVGIQRRRKPCYSCEIHVPTLAKILDTQAHKNARSWTLKLNSNCNRPFDLTGQHHNKNFYVTETVLQLGFTKLLFRWREATTRNTPVPAGFYSPALIHSYMHVYMHF